MRALQIQVSLACWPAASQLEALRACVRPDGSSAMIEPLWGRLCAQHAQLVPQSRGIINEEYVAFLRQHYPSTQFRLHANARVQLLHRVVDIADYARPECRSWFNDAARISRLLGAPAYSAHSGLRARATVRDIVLASQRLADLFGCPVAIEGQYPTPPDNRFLIDSWEEYRELFDSGAYYALDLSHLNILAAKTGRIERTLTAEMLACERCLEVHVSSNDGHHDQHDVCQRHHPPWWLALLEQHTHEKAVIFSEGDQRRARAQRPKAAPHELSHR